MNKTAAIRQLLSPTTQIGIDTLKYAAGLALTRQRETVASRVCAHVAASADHVTIPKQCRLLQQPDDVTAAAVYGLNALHP